MNHILKIIFFLCFYISMLFSEQLKKVTLQLHWLNQFEFAGYFMAKEKGFYKEAGLSVNIKEYNNNINVLNEVMSKYANYGIGRSSLIINRANGADIQLIFSAFQSSSEFLSIKKYIPKRTQADFVPSHVFNPKDYGFDFYSDILFTSEHEITNHRDRVISFKNASLKGWEYAFSHIDESVEVILKKYNNQYKSKESLIYEANLLKKLAYHKTNKIGNIDKEKIKKIYDAYYTLGAVKNKINFDKLIFDENANRLNLTIEEKKWIKNNPVLKFSQINWEPFSIIQNNKIKGIIKDYLDLISQKTGLNFEYIPSDSRQSIFEKFKKFAIDIVPSTKYLLKDKSLGLVSNVYKTYPMVIVTNQKYKYVGSLDNLNDKKVALPMCYTSYNYIKEKFPNISIIKTNSIKQALLLAESGNADAFVGHIATALSYITKLRLANLKVSGTTKFNFEHVFLIHKQDKVLLSIINKALNTITYEEKENIDSKWINEVVEQKTDYVLLIKLLSFSLLLVLILLYRSKKLSEYNEKLEYSNRIILEKEEKLKKLNVQLINNVSDALQDLKASQRLAKIGIWRAEVKKDILFWDDFNYTLFNRNKIDDPIKSVTNFKNLIHPDDFEKVKNAYYSHIQSKLPYYVMHRVVLDDGSIKYVEERGETSYDKYGNPTITKGTTQDVTQQQLTIIALRRKDEQILQQSRLAQMGEMLSMIAHQWRQPLSAISATTSNLKFKIMLDDVDTKTFEKELVLIDGFTQHLSKTIEDFRGFFKKEKKKNITTLKEVVNSTLDIVKISIENKNIKIHKNFTCNKNIKIYTNEIKQVVLNLMKNAEDILLEKNIENPYISIETKFVNNTLSLSIKDNGGGIPLSIKDKIFDPYFTTKDKKDGTGLGLYMSKIIVEEHCGGKLYVNNDKDGAVFSIEFILKQTING